MGKCITQVFFFFGIGILIITAALSGLPNKENVNRRKFWRETNDPHPACSFSTVIIPFKAL